MAGILQSDGYGAYDHVGQAGIVHAACWAHARRKFFEAVKVNPKDQSSIRIVAQMDELHCGRRPLKIPIRDILGSVLPASANFPINRIAELTPAAWLVRNYR